MTPLYMLGALTFALVAGGSVRLAWLSWRDREPAGMVLAVMLAALCAAGFALCVEMTARTWGPP